MQTLVPNLWFDTEAEQAATFYASLFPDGQVLGSHPYGPDMPGPEGTTAYVEWTMLGQRYVGINGGPQFPFTEAVSFEVRCDDQGEIDALWEALADGGEPGPCGWIKDRFGFAWQVSPAVLATMMDDPDPARVARATQYFMGLDRQRFDIATLERAFAGASVTSS